MNESIRPVTRDDLAAIAAIQAAAPEAAQWEPASYLQHDCMVAIEQGEIAGFIVTREIADGERSMIIKSEIPSLPAKGGREKRAYEGV